MPQTTPEVHPSGNGDHRSLGPCSPALSSGGHRLRTQGSESFADSSVAGPSSFEPALLKEVLTCGSCLGERACLLALLRLVN